MCVRVLLLGNVVEEEVHDASVACCTMGVRPAGPE